MPKSIYAARESFWPFYLENECYNNNADKEVVPQKALEYVQLIWFPGIEFIEHLKQIALHAISEPCYICCTILMSNLTLSLHLTENKRVEYECVLHFICMCWVIIFQLQEANSIEVESKEDRNLKQSLKEKMSAVQRTIL
jgi:hypothetical protein